MTLPAEIPIAPFTSPDAFRLALEPELHILTPMRIGGRTWKRCSCGWTAECFDDWPTACRMEEAEITLWHRVELAKATFADEVTRIQAVSRIEAEEVRRLASASH